jgi:hypothetical protein
MSEAAPRVGAVPYSEAGGRTDDVMRIRAIVERLKGCVEGLEWVKPSADTAGHSLKWTENGHQREVTRERLGWLCDWAERKWPR